MPTIVIDGPPIKDLDRKRILVKALSEAAAQAYDLASEKMTVLIKENQPENVGVGGMLLLDRRTIAKTPSEQNK